MKFKMSNHLYDALKYLAQVILPAAGTLYFALSSIWGLPFAEQVVGTISAIDVFLGVVLQISTDNYNSDKINSEYYKTYKTLEEYTKNKR